MTQRIRLVDRARVVADAALVVGTDTVVFVITNAIVVLIRNTRPTTFTKRVEQVAVTVAVSFG